VSIIVDCQPRLHHRRGVVSFYWGVLVLILLAAAGWAQESLPGTTSSTPAIETTPASAPLAAPAPFALPAVAADSPPIAGATDTSTTSLIGSAPTSVRTPASDTDVHAGPAQSGTLASFDLATFTYQEPTASGSERVGLPPGSPCTNLLAPILAVASGQVMVLDPTSRTIQAYRPDLGSVSVVLRDQKPGLIQFADFAWLQGGRVAIGDNSRQAILLFNNKRFSRILGRIGERHLFGYIRFLFANPEGDRFGVCDTMKKCTYLFAADGRLLAEQPGIVAPCFFQKSLVSLRQSEKELLVELVDPVTRSSRTLLGYHPQPGRIVLDAWAVGSDGDQLVMVVYEGIGDEDHLDLAKVVIYRDGQMRVETFPPTLDLDLDLVRPYGLLRAGPRLWLVELLAGDGSLTLRGWQLE
jgi:hypothetical protein